MERRHKDLRVFGVVGAWERDRDEDGGRVEGIPAAVEDGRFGIEKRVEVVEKEEGLRERSVEE